MDERAERWARTGQEWRDRRRLAGYGGNVHPASLAYWQTCRWPADPVYLLDLGPGTAPVACRATPSREFPG